MIEDQLIMYDQTYILHMFRGFIFTSTAGNAISLFFFTLFEDFGPFLITTRGYACISISTTM